jgi:ubiquitin carboxyl-terminal hydrolase 34
MESIPIGLPATPTRATSAGPSPPRRNLMEDADSSVTRKRPRLDSGERTRRSMSADPLTAASSSFEHSFTPRRGEKSAAATAETANCTSIDRTPSKVTINVRDPVQTGTSSVPGMNGVHVQPSSDRNETYNHSQTESSIRIESRSDVISVASTPTRSPEIEVAEVEDINEEPGQTRWRPLTNVMDGKDLQEALMKKFPFAVGVRNVRETVRLLGQAFEKRKLATIQVCVQPN